MRYGGTLVSVCNIEVSKKFYKEVFGLEVVNDFGANAELSGGISLQTEVTWGNFIQADKVTVGNDFELFFEEENFDGFVNKLKRFESIRYVHDVLEHSWGQRVVRIYDPDGHIIEVGENMKVVIKRFLNSGMTEEETAVRMDVPLEYIKRNR